MPKTSKKIAIASDHAGFDLKSFLIDYLKKKGVATLDLGCDGAEKSVDYPDYAFAVAKKIIEKEVDFGILICGSGIGVSIAANRFKEVRAALCVSEEMAKLSRNHNDANVLCLGARLTNQDLAAKILDAFLNAEFEGKRHVARIEKIS